MKRKSLADDPHDVYLTKLQELTLPHVLRRLKSQPSMKSRNVNALLGFHLAGSEIEPLFRRMTVFEKVGKVFHLLPQIKILDMENMTDAELVRYLKEEDWESGPAKKKQKGPNQPARILRSAQAGPSTRAKPMNAASLKLAIPDGQGGGSAANLETVPLTEVARTCTLDPEFPHSRVPNFTLPAESRIKQEDKENTNPTSAESASTQACQQAAKSISDNIVSIPPKAPAISTACRSENVPQTTFVGTTTSSKSTNAFTFSASKSSPTYRTTFGQQQLIPGIERTSTAFPHPQGLAGGGLLQASIRSGAYSFGPTSTTFISGRPFTSQPAKSIGGRSVSSPFKLLAPISSTWIAPWKMPQNRFSEKAKQADASGILNPWRKNSSTPVVSVRSNSALEPFGWQTPKNSTSATTVTTGSTSLPTVTEKPATKTSCDIAVQTDASSLSQTPRRSVSDMSASSASMSISSSSTSASSSTSVEVHAAELSNVNNTSTVRLPSIHTLLKYGEHEACITMGIIDYHTGAVHTLEQKGSRINLGDDHVLKPVVMNARMSDGTKCWATIRIRRAQL